VDEIMFVVYALILFHMWENIWWLTQQMQQF